MGTIIKQETYESATWKNNFYNETGNANGITRSNEVPARNGGFVGKYMVTVNDTPAGGSRRSESSARFVNANQNPKPPNNLEDNWYGFSIYLPASFVPDVSEESIFQFHAEGTVSIDGFSMLNAPLFLGTKNGRWVLNNKYAASYVTTDLGLYETNKWTDWVLHYKMSWGSDGVLQLWRNGVLVVDKTGPNMFHTTEGYFQKMGIYKWDWAQGNPSGTTQRTLYFDEFRIGDSTCSYEDVAPRPFIEMPVTSTSPNINLQVTSAGTYTGRLKVTANGLSHEKAVEIVITDPVIVPPVSPYPPDSTYTNLGALPMLVEPGYLQEISENVNYADGATRSITRISDPLVFNTSTASLLTHHYSKTRAWNCDQSMMIVGRHILEGGVNTMHKVLINLVNTVGVNHQWSFIDPNLCYYIDNNRLYKFVVNAGKTAVTRTLLYDFKVNHGFAWVQLGPSEGQIARNDSTMALNIADDGVGGKRIIVFNINTLTITANKTHEEMGLVSDGSWRTDRPNLNFATITPSGNFVVCRIENATGSHLLFDNNLNYIRDLGGGSHMDFGFNQAGKEVAVCMLPLCYQELANNPSGTRLILATQAQMVAANGSTDANSGTGGHASCAWQRDGWMYVSFSSFRKEILAFKLDTSGIVERFCFARDNTGSATETQGCPSPDGTMVVFKAKWNGDANTLAYLVKRKS